MEALKSEVEMSYRVAACFWWCRVDSMDVEPVYTMRGHSGAVLSLAINPSGEFCYGGGVDGSICCWNIPNLSIDPYDAYGGLPQTSTRVLLVK